MCKCIGLCLKIFVEISLWIFSSAILVIGIALLISTSVVYFDGGYNPVILLFQQAMIKDGNGVGIVWVFIISWIFSAYLILTSIF